MKDLNLFQTTQYYYHNTENHPPNLTRRFLDLG
jgi:hypothetical protein